MRIRHKIAEYLRLLSWRIAGKPTSVAIPTYHDYKLIGYEEFKLNEIGLIYIDDGLRRYIFLFDTEVLNRAIVGEG